MNQTLTTSTGKVSARLAILRADLRALFAELRAAGWEDLGSYEPLRAGLTATDHYTLIAMLRAKDGLHRKGVWVDRPDFDEDLQEATLPKEAA